jgi:ATP-dependent RNA helicase A
MNILRQDSGYSTTTINAMSQISERDINYELLVALLQHIKSFNIPGAILVFLPGWNVIFGILKYLQDHPIFGTAINVCMINLR